MYNTTFSFYFNQYRKARSRVNPAVIPSYHTKKTIKTLLNVPRGGGRGAGALATLAVAGHNGEREGVACVVNDGQIRRFEHKADHLENGFFVGKAVARDA